MCLQCAIGLLCGSAVPLVLAIYFEEGSAEEKWEVGGSYRATESLGKLAGKALLGTVYMPWFMAAGGMACDSSLENDPR